MHNKSKILSAGPLSSWLRNMRAALAADSGVEVNCGKCTACCRSSLFIQIRPGEKETLRHIPKKYLQKDPGMPRGHMLLGYLENGHCPMFRKGACSIYKYRPLTCRQFDCRVYTAANFVPCGKEKEPVALAAVRWKFDVKSPEERAVLSSIRAKARQLCKKYQADPSQWVIEAIEKPGKKE